MKHTEQLPPLPPPQVVKLAEQLAALQHKRSSEEVADLSRYRQQVNTKSLRMAAEEQARCGGGGGGGGVAGTGSR